MHAALTKVNTGFMPVIQLPNEWGRHSVSHIGREEFSVFRIRDNRPSRSLPKILHSFYLRSCNGYLMG